jgi:hypothetical protein
MTKTAVVLGAGIQGVCVALMLQKHGYRVQLIDKSHDIINRTSLTYEGKVHLGFVYGMDKSMQTGYKMIRDALHFAPYMEYLLDKDEDWLQFRSKPNIYLVAHDSMLSPQEIEIYFEKINAYFQDCLSDERLHYLGTRPQVIFRKIDIPTYISSGFVSASFITEEMSVDQVKIKDVLKQKITASTSIDLFLEQYVTGIRTNPDGYIVECKRQDGTTATIKSDIVFNCLWEKRIYFDRMVGINDESSHSLRLKYGLVLQADDFLHSLHSLTMIHGPYGNFVINPYSNRAFCSWYPASMKGLMEYGDVPDTWEQACDGYASNSLIEALRKDNLEGFRQFIPNLNDLTVLKVTAGVILAEGIKDITEHDSTFHSRNETPIREKAGYFSVNTSKYTSAPRNTMILEQMLFK